jgi:hypothetical protein
MLGEAGETLTVATGTAVTVTVAVAERPSLVAVMVALPVAFAVTTPVFETVATLVLLLDQATVRPVSVLLLASRSVAVSACVAPTVILGAVGETLTLETATAVTVIATVVDLPPLAAVIVALPAVTAVTIPALETVATELLLLVQVTVRPAKVLLRESRTVAINDCVAPTVILAEVGETVTLATVAAVTVIVEVPELPSLDAVIVAVPALIAVTTPFESTVAIFWLLLDQVMVRPVTA